MFHFFSRRSTPTHTHVFSKDTLAFGIFVPFKKLEANAFPLPEPFLSNMLEQSEQIQSVGGRYSLVIDKTLMSNAQYEALESLLNTKNIELIILSQLKGYAPYHLNEEAHPEEHSRYLDQMTLVAMRYLLSHSDDSTRTVSLSFNIPLQNIKQITAPTTGMSFLPTSTHFNKRSDLALDNACMVCRGEKALETIEHILKKCEEKHLGHTPFGLTVGHVVFENLKFQDKLTTCFANFLMHILNQTTGLSISHHHLSDIKKLIETLMRERNTELYYVLAANNFDFIGELINKIQQAFSLSLKTYQETSDTTLLDCFKTCVSPNTKKISRHIIPAALLYTTELAYFKELEQSHQLEHHTIKGFAEGSIFHTESWKRPDNLTYTQATC